MTNAERLLWRRLRRHALGVSFRRQAPIRPYIVDFLSLEARLVIEIDGGQHLESEADRLCDASLEARGYRVLRFWNDEVLRKTEEVLAEVEREVRKALAGGRLEGERPG